MTCRPFQMKVIIMTLSNSQSCAYYCKFRLVLRDAHLSLFLKHRILMLISVAAVPLGALYVFIWELLPPGEQAQAMTKSIVSWNVSFIFAL